MEEVSSQKGREGELSLLRGKTHPASAEEELLSVNTPGACPRVGTWWLQHPQLSSLCFSGEPPPLQRHLSCQRGLPRCPQEEAGVWLRGDCSWGSVPCGLRCAVPRCACSALAAPETPTLRSGCLHPSAVVHPPPEVRALLGHVEAPGSGAGAGSGQHWGWVSQPTRDSSGQRKGNHPVPSLAGVEAAPTLPWGCLS